MIQRLAAAGSDRVATIRFSDRHDGDFAINGSGPRLSRARQSTAPGPWTWLNQVHGSHVVTVRTPGDEAGSQADASVTSAAGAVLAVQTADCAPIVLVGDGAVGVAHAGWRGLVAGVIPAAVAALADLGAGEVRAVIGPVIRPGHYEFDERELSQVIARVGEQARARTVDGRTALDLAAAVSSDLERAGVTDIDDLGLDTASPDYFSHRCRADVGRQTSVVWLEDR